MISLLVEGTEPPTRLVFPPWMQIGRLWVEQWMRIWESWEQVVGRRIAEPLEWNLPVQSVAKDSGRG